MRILKNLMSIINTFSFFVSNNKNFICVDAKKLNYHTSFIIKEGITDLNSNSL
jgi:hypothetical protein